MAEQRNNPIDKLAGSRYGVLFLIAVLSLNLILSVSSSFQKSVTVDEFGTMPNGIAILKARAFHIDEGTAPLAKVLVALPSIICSAKLDVSPLPDYRSSWQCGRQFAGENPVHYHHYFMLGRFVSILFLLITCILTFIFARSLYTPAAGIIAAIFVSLSPNLLAHGRLVTRDIYFAAAVMGTLWAFDLFIRKRDRPRALMLGVMLGITCICKFTGLLLVVILLPALMIMHFVRKKGPADTRPAAILNRRTVILGIIALAVFVLIINLGYLFDGSFTPIGEFQFKTSVFQKLRGILPSWLPVSLPYHYLSGLDQQLYPRGYDAYLLGKWSRTGFWNYYLIGFLVKTSVPILILTAAAFILKPRFTLREIPMLLICILMFVFFSLAKHKNIGIRYLLFIIPVACVWISRITISSVWNSKKGAGYVTSALAVGAVWMLISALIIWPNYLAFFNVISGGPARGHKYLLDSNIDWGQDLIALKKYMEKENIETVDLAYFGRVRPEIYGINHRLLKDSPEHRYVVISKNLLWGRIYFINGTDYLPADRDTFAYFRKIKPETILGHSLYVFDMQNR